MDTLSKSGAAVSTIPLRTICWRLNISPTYLLDPFVKVTLQQRGKWISVGKSEVIENNHNPQFLKEFKIDYHFEEQQNIGFDVFDFDKSGHHDFLGRCIVSVGSVMTTAGLMLQIPLKDKSLSKGAPRGRSGIPSLTIIAEVESTCKDKLLLHLRANNLDRKDGLFGKSDPFFELSRRQEGVSTWVPVFKSEVIKQNLNPTWQRATLPLVALNGGNNDTIFRISVWDYDSDGSRDLIGHAEVTLPQLIENQVPVDRLIPMVNTMYPHKAPGGAAAKRSKKVLPHWIPLIHPPTKPKYRKKSYKSSGFIEVLAIERLYRHSLTDYLQGGLELKLTMAIDFTASNGAISTPDSLHYIDPRGHRLNQYQEAIRAVGAILQEYDHDKMIPVYGFGGQVDGTVSHCFPLTFDQRQVEVHGVTGIEQAYLNSLHCGRVRLLGPTYFAPVIKATLDEAREARPGDEYSILLIITDGVILDLPKTIKQIVDASYAPMSIIIVGVGAADFSSMDKLDADDILLQYREGSRPPCIAKRDIVQFVPMREFHNNAAALAAHTLAELPGQVEEFMASNKLKPKPHRAPRLDPVSAPPVIATAVVPPRIPHQVASSHTISAPVPVVANAVPVTANYTTVSTGPVPIATARPPTFAGVGQQVQGAQMFLNAFGR